MCGAYWKTYKFQLVFFAYENGGGTYSAVDYAQAVKHAQSGKYGWKKLLYLLPCHYFAAVGKVCLKTYAAYILHYRIGSVVLGENIQNRLYAADIRRTHKCGVKLDKFRKIGFIKRKLVWSHRNYFLVPFSYAKGIGHILAYSNLASRFGIKAYVQSGFAAVSDKLSHYVTLRQKSFWGKIWGYIRFGIETAAEGTGAVIVKLAHTAHTQICFFSHILLKSLSVFFFFYCFNFTSKILYCQVNKNHVLQFLLTNGGFGGIFIVKIKFFGKRFLHNFQRGYKTVTKKRRRICFLKRKTKTVWP